MTAIAGSWMLTKPSRRPGVRNKSRRRANLWRFGAAISAGLMMFQAPGCAITPIPAAELEVAVNQFVDGFVAGVLQGFISELTIF